MNYRYTPNLAFPPERDNTQEIAFIWQGRFTFADDTTPDPEKVKAVAEENNCAAFVLWNYEGLPGHPGRQYLIYRDHPAYAVKYRRDLVRLIEQYSTVPFGLYMTYGEVARSYNVPSSASRARIMGEEAQAALGWIGSSRPIVSAYWHDRPDYDPETAPDRWVFERWKRITTKEVEQCRFNLRREPLLIHSVQRGGGPSATLAQSIGEPELAQPPLSKELDIAMREVYRDLNVEVCDWVWGGETDFPDYLPRHMYWFGA